MEPEDVKRYAKRIGIVGSFFALALLFYFLGWARALTAYAVLWAVVLVLSVLIQSGRGGGLASLGGLDTDSLLGTRSATPIAKATYVLGALFIVSCMLVARLGMVQRGAVSREPSSMPFAIPSPAAGPEERGGAGSGPEDQGGGIGGEETIPAEHGGESAE